MGVLSVPTDRTSLNSSLNTKDSSSRGLEGVEPPPGTYHPPSRVPMVGARCADRPSYPTFCPSSYSAAYPASDCQRACGERRDKKKKGPSQVLRDSNPRRAHTTSRKNEWMVPGAPTDRTFLYSVLDTRQRAIKKFFDETGLEGLEPPPGTSVEAICVMCPKRAVKDRIKNRGNRQPRGLGGFEPPPGTELMKIAMTWMVPDPCSAARCLNTDGRQIDAGAAAAGGVHRGICCTVWHALNLNGRWVARASAFGRQTVAHAAAFKAEQEKHASRRRGSPGGLIVSTASCVM
ncbi:hypothetical protein DFH09DRAFT_1091612 [Mycena vulgaris]|nr:hypothetical protein DFH09DRAFT_1091612 [Mycena vulgaris]